MTAAAEASPPSLFCGQGEPPSNGGDAAATDSLSPLGQRFLEPLSEPRLTSIDEFKEDPGPLRAEVQHAQWESARRRWGSSCWGSWAMSILVAVGRPCGCSLCLALPGRSRRRQTRAGPPSLTLDSACGIVQEGREKGLAQAERALPHLRDFSHKSKEVAMDFRDQVKEKRHDLVQRVSGFDVPSLMHAEAAHFHRTHDKQAQADREWRKACKAAHLPHNPHSDPPLPPERATSSTALPQSDLPPELARGCLEVEVLGLRKGSAPLHRPDGSPALCAIVQLILGEQCTGALSLGSGDVGPQVMATGSVGSRRGGASSSSHLGGTGSAGAGASAGGGLAAVVMDAGSCGDGSACAGHPSVAAAVAGGGDLENHSASSAAIDATPGDASIDLAASSASSASGAGTFMPSTRGAFEKTALSPTVQPGEAMQPSAVRSARFVVDEVAGCDLKVHVFDRDSLRFGVGLEHTAFCGGSVVPLSTLLRHNASSGFFFRGFGSKRLETRLSVALLPLQVVRCARKLRPADPTSAMNFEQPPEDLGSIVLHLRLTLYEQAPALLYCAVPFRGEAQQAHWETGRVDEPKSVKEAVAASLLRIKRNRTTKVWVGALDRLREAPHLSVAILWMWSYTVLLAPVWMVPGCILAGLLTLSWQVAYVGECMRRERPALLYWAEVAPGSKDRGPLRRAVTKAVKAQVYLLRFANKLNMAAAVIEKIRFLFMFRDPYLSVVFTGILLAVTVLSTVLLRVLVALFGSFGLPVLVWAMGLVALLPRRFRSYIFRFFCWMKQMKLRYIGHGKLLQVLMCLWERVPEGIEEQHYDLCERYVLGS